MINLNETKSSDMNISLFLFVSGKSYSMPGCGLHRTLWQVTESSLSLLSTHTLASQMASAHNKATPSAE